MRVYNYIYTFASTCLVLILVLLPAAYANEQITDYHARIEIAKNGDLTVTETISVIAEGRNINRGIFRDFPLYFISSNGTEKRVDFDIISIKRNGNKEPYHTSYVNSDIRIYIGEEDYYIDRGPHTYEIKYQTDRQMQFFNEGDELYWNVTGNFWQFQINKASAEVHAPDNGKISGVAFFTGRVGQQLQFANAKISDDGRSAFFETTKALSQGEGLTIVAQMPVGTVNKPTESQEFWWFMRDFGHVVVATITLIIVGLYYGISWLIIGRDPTPSHIRERQTTSLGISPALVRYIYNRSRVDGTFTSISAAILNLAVKDYIKIEDIDGDPQLVVSENRELQKLPVGEAAIMEAVNKYGTFRITKSNGKSLTALRSSFNNAISSEHRNMFYKHNSGAIALGIILTIVGLGATMVFNIMGLFTLITSTIFAIIAGVLLIPIYLLGKWFLSFENDGLRYLLVSIMSVIGVVGAGLIIAGIYLVIEDTNTWSHIPFAIVAVLLVALNIFFFDLMGRPTNMGAELMAQIEGLKLHLENYHEQRMNLAGTPRMSPKYFEKQLPYAVALDIEKPWSETFDKWLESAEAKTAGVSSYRPRWDRDRWYHNRRDNDKRFKGFTNHMSKSISSAMPVQRSSSSGSSSGSSGGGGGGGGGGGW
ncbi:DUF2207 domain-containing protein [Lentilitoribacter sp. EG35]|uniref:DUF2207 domain-containing protein n=1 Tax=Lentilitoribacter sp. EG35 TaxID=3234192 RepID=UPI0034600768